MSEKNIEAAVREQLRKMGIAVDTDDGGISEALARAVNGSSAPGREDGLAGALGHALGRPIALNDDQALGRIAGGPGARVNQTGPTL